MFVNLSHVSKHFFVSIFKFVPLASNVVILFDYNLKISTNIPLFNTIHELLIVKPFYTVMFDIDNLLHVANAPVSIDVILIGINTDVKLLQFAKSDFEIDVILCEIFYIDVNVLSLHFIDVIVSLIVT
jgi:hypothetical protein